MDPFDNTTTMFAILSTYNDSVGSNFTTNITCAKRSSNQSGCNNILDSNTIVELSFTIAIAVAFLYIAALAVVLAAHFRWCRLDLLFDYHLQKEEENNERILKSRIIEQLVTKVSVSMITT